MKLIDFSHQKDLIFKLSFENGEIIQTDLSILLIKYIQVIQIDTAKIDTNWGCLEFNDGMIDIEPKTLYHYAMMK
jgi:hypothetical protein